MTQLKIDLGTLKNKPGRKPLDCPWCDQAIKTPNLSLIPVADARKLLAGASDLAFKRVFAQHLAENTSIDLSGHTWLLWALKSEAKYNNRSLSEQVALIVDSYMESKRKQIT